MDGSNRPGSQQLPSQPPSLQATSQTSPELRAQMYEVVWSRAPASSQETPQASPQTVSPGSLSYTEARAPLSRSFTAERYYSSGANHRSHCSRACDSCRNRRIKCSGEDSGCDNCNGTNGICAYSESERETWMLRIRQTFILNTEDTLRRSTSPFPLSTSNLSGNNSRRTTR
ncbi:hypothetical protein BJX62DRAFT_98706 [Aspergillus germanicus]